MKHGPLEVAEQSKRAENDSASHPTMARQGSRERTAGRNEGKSEELVRQEDSRRGGNGRTNQLLPGRALPSGLGCTHEYCGTGRIAAWDVCFLLDQDVWKI